MTNNDSLRDHRFLDKLVLDGYCPGFYLWEVRLFNDDNVYLMAADYEGALSTRVFFATNGAVQQIESAVKLGDNPDKTSWDMAQEKRYRS